jgi:hypothetical protein
MIIENVSEINEQLPVAFSLLLQFIQVTQKYFPKADDVIVEDNFIYIVHDAIKYKIFLTDEIFRNFLIDENVIVNVIGNPTGRAWSYFIFADGNLATKLGEVNFLTYHEALLEGFKTAMLLINKKYNIPLNKELTNGKVN